MQLSTHVGESRDRAVAASIIDRAMEAKALAIHFFLIDRRNAYSVYFLAGSGELVESILIPQDEVDRIKAVYHANATLVLDSPPQRMQTTYRGELRTINKPDTLASIQYLETFDDHGSRFSLLLQETA